MAFAPHCAAPGTNWRTSWTSRGERFVLRLSRAWYVLGACAGLAMIAAARPPRMAAEGVDVGSVAIFAAVTGVGVGVALRSAAMFMATYSTNLLVHRFHVSLQPSLIRAGVVAVIGFAAWQFPWPISGWVALALAAIAWTVYPLLQHTVIAARAPRHITHRMLPVDQMLSMNARSLPTESRRQIAVHEAGHAVFFASASRFQKTYLRGSMTRSRHLMTLDRDKPAAPCLPLPH